MNTRFVVAATASLLALLFLFATPAQAGTIWNVRIKNSGKEQLVVRQVQSKCWLPGSFEKPSTVRPGESQELFSEMDDLKACSIGVNKEWSQDIEIKSPSKTYNYTLSFDKKKLRSKGDWSSLTCDAPSACCSSCRVSIEIN